MKVWEITIVVFAFWLLLPANVQAAGVLFRDSFNEPSLRNWRVERNFQWTHNAQPCMNIDQPAQWQIRNGQLGFVIDGPSCITDIVPRLLDLSHIHNYQYDFDMTLNETTLADRGFIFNWQDPTTWYGFKLFDGIVAIHSSDHGSYRILENSLRYSFSANDTYHVTVIVKDDSRFILKIDDQIILDISDYPHSFKGFKTVGFEASNGTVPRAVVFFDNLVVKSLDPGINLDIPVIKQTDDQWQATEYDSAKSWAKNPTIGRWGCSLTSMVMILRYYGLNFLPDGTYIDPETLNTWLQSQSDGYIGEGNLNWLAITRLSRLIHARYGTPKLEFKRYPGNISIAKSEVESQRPVIIKIDGHFMVSDGVTPDEQDLLIKDPAFSHNTFSEYQVPALSIESFTPSFTDLSYLLVSHASGVSARLLTEQGNEVTDFEEAGESLTEFPEENTTRPLELTQKMYTNLLPKPTDQTYVLEVKSVTPDSYPLTIFAYDREGNLTDISQTVFLNSNPKYFSLHYSKDAPTSIDSNISFATFRQDLEIGNKLQKISSGTALLRLNEVSGLAEFSGVSRQKRYLQYLSELLGFFSNFIQSDLAIILKNDLLELSKQLNVIISR